MPSIKPNPPRTTPSKRAASLKAFLHRSSGLRRLSWSKQPKNSPRGEDILKGKPKQPSTPELPTELLLIIFQYLATPVYFHLLGYTYPETRTYEVKPEAKAGDEQLHIVRAMLVCRSWAKAGTTFLYSRPLLTCRTSILHFARTLSDTPGLAALVRHIIVADEGGPPRGSASWRVSVPLKQYLKTRSPNDTASRKALWSVLTDCPDLESMIIAPPFRSDSPGYVVPPVSSFQRVSPSGAHLRKLMFYGHEISLALNNTVHLDEISFPVLEVLCLREVNLDRDHPFPSSLPALRKLMITQSHLTPYTSEKKLHISQKQFPALEHTELYDNSFSLTFDTSVYLRLQRMYVLDTAYSSYIRGSDAAGSKLKHVALGIFGTSHYSDAPMSLRIVPALETLSVAISFEKHDEEHQFLRGLIGAISEAGRNKTLKLKKIILFTGSNEPRIQGIKGVLLALNETCELYRVQVVMADEGISPWVNRNLLAEFGL